MPLADIASVSISVSARGPTQQGFGEQLIVAPATWQGSLVAEYSQLSDMTAAGCPVTDAAYLVATVMASQQPCPPFWKVGRETNTEVQIINLTLTSTNASDVYAFNIRAAGGVYAAISLQSTGVPNTDNIALSAAVTALAIPNLTVTHATAIMTLTMAVGKLIDIQFPALQPVQLGNILTLTDTSTAPDLATSLAAIQSYDPNWYGLNLANNSPAAIAIAETFCEANGKLGGFNTSQTACTDPASTTDIMYLAKTAAYVRSFTLFAGTQLLCYSAAGLMAENFPSPPGSENWAFKTIAGVVADNLTTGAIHAVENKNGTVYTPVAGLNLTQFGRTPGGTFVDITRFIDWLKNQIQTQLLALLANANKVPFTDKGIDAVRGVISSVLQAGVDAGGLASFPAPFVSTPKAIAVDPINKAARNLPNVSFKATLAGAINSIVINGVVTS